jgi:hypothetical protein
MTLNQFVSVSRNYMKNVTPFAYQNNSPVPDAHTYFVIDHNGECVDEFDEWKEAKECYQSQSPENLVGAWLIYAVELVTLN